MNPLYDYFQKNRMIVRIENAQKKKVRNLSLDDLDLTTIPDVLMNLQDVHSLALHRNQLSELPKEFGTRMKQLTHLSIQYNNFKCFPECLKYLTSLITLNISHNNIKQIPKDIECLKKLEVLWCNSCGLTSLPDELGKLTKMETFGARHNDINQLPNFICNWKNLRWLTLEENNLSSLPKNFYKLKSLVHLNISRNNFRIFPDCISNISSLRYLFLQHNFIEAIPLEIVIAKMQCKINLVDNPVAESIDVKLYSNVTINDDELFYSLGVPAVDSDDSSEEDWENSSYSLDLNYSTTDSSSSDSEDDEIVEKFPKLCKYFVAY